MDNISTYDSPRTPRGSIGNNGAVSGGKTPRGSAAMAALDKQAALELVMGQQAPAAFGQEQEANEEGWSGCAALPDGWVLLAAPDGTPYYYNEGTQESSWTLPQDSAQPPLPPKAGALLSGDGPSRRTNVGWVGEGEGGPDEGMRTQLEATQAELSSLKAQLQALKALGPSKGDRDSAANHEEIDRLHAVIRRLRVEREDLEGALEEAERDARAGHKARKELEFVRRRLEEVEGELCSATSWEGLLTHVEETLRGAFSKEQHTGDWVVSLDLLQDLVSGVDTILGSFRPYLPSTGAAPTPTPITSATTSVGASPSNGPTPSDASKTMDMLQQSRALVVELEGRLKVLEAQLKMSEERRVEDTAALKETIHTLSHAVAQRASVPPVSPVGVGVGGEALLVEVEGLRTRLATLQRQHDAACERVRVLQGEVESGRSLQHKTQAALDTLTRQHTRLQTQLSDGVSSGGEEARALSLRVHSLTAELDQAHKALSTAQDQHVAQVCGLEKQLRVLEESLTHERSLGDSGAQQLHALTAQIQHAHTEHAAQVSVLKKKLMCSEEALHKAQEEAEHAHSHASKAHAHAHELEVEVGELKASLQQLRAKSASDLAARESSLMATLDTLRAKNRTLNERILEMQGNIRVLCRVRPLSRRELEAMAMGTSQGEGGPSPSPSLQMDSLLQYPEEGLLLFHDNKFEYDQVYRPESSQESIFRDVQPAVWSSLQGYRVSIFAYGQTGSGKTFTMEGSPDNRGVNYRAINELFTLIASSQATHEYQVKMSMLEVYNESIQDLLGEGRGSGGNSKGLDVRAGAKGVGVYVEGLVQVDVTAMADVEALMTMGQRNRHVGATNMNEHSSRSHLVITLTLLGANRKTGARVTGKLNLIDLAGSERLKTTGATGERLEEAKNINKSLSALGDVIASLASASAHVPYRNSKLTFLLQDSLSPAAKVVMFVNINPAPASASESLCSLNFAARCRAVQLGQAKKGPPSAPVTPRKGAAGAGEEEDRPPTPTTPRK